MITQSHDGYLFDDETGEIVGHASAGDEAAPFQVCDLDSASWVLRKRLEAESQIAALEAQRATINRQLDAMRADFERRIKWLDFRFTGELCALAAKLLTGQKTRSVKTPFGTFGWRKTQGNITVRREASEYAVLFAQTINPDAVVTEKRILVSELRGYEAELPSDLFEVTPPEDKFFVSTKVNHQ